MIEWVARGLAAFCALGAFLSVWIGLQSGSIKFAGGGIPVLRSNSPVTYAATIGVHIAGAVVCAAVALGLIELA